MTFRRITFLFTAPQTRISRKFILPNLTNSCFVESVLSLQYQVQQVRMTFHSNNRASEAEFSGKLYELPINYPTLDNNTATETELRIIEVSEN